MFLELLDDLRLVGWTKRRCLHDGSELGIFLKDVVEGLEGTCYAVEGGVFAGGGVL